MSAEYGLLSHRLQAKLAVTTGENMKLNEKLVSLRKAQKLNQAQAAEVLNESAQPPVSGSGRSSVKGGNGHGFY